MMMTVNEIASLIGGKVKGDGTVQIKGAGSVEGAEPGDISFVASPRFRARAKDSRASALIVSDEGLDAPMPLIVVADPRLAFTRLVEKFNPETRPKPGIHAQAVVAPDAVLGREVSVGPFAVIGSLAKLGDGVVIGAGCVVGESVVIGEGTRLYPRVTLYPGVELGQRVIVHSGAVIGADGFGFIVSPAGHTKIPQVGRVIVEDDVEIGANCTIDRAGLDVSRIGAGTKLDNQVHIAHGVRLGKNCIVLAQTAIGGSTVVGDNTLISGLVVIKDNLVIGSNVRIVAMSGVLENIPDGETVWGLPAFSFSHAKKALLRLRQLPDLFSRMRRIEKHLSLGKPDKESGQ